MNVVAVNERGHSGLFVLFSPFYVNSERIPEWKECFAVFITPGDKRLEVSGKQIVVLGEDRSKHERRDVCGWCLIGLVCGLSR